MQQIFIFFYFANNCIRNEFNNNIKRSNLIITLNTLYIDTNMYMYNNKYKVELSRNVYMTSCVCIYP